MWMLLLKICLLTTLFYSLYHWALRGNTFFRFNRVYLLAGMFIALALPFIPLYYAGNGFSDWQYHKYRNESQ